MSALTRIVKAGFNVALVDGFVEISPASSLTRQQREFVKLHRAEIVAQLSITKAAQTNELLQDIREQIEERAAIMGYDGGLSRQDPVLEMKMKAFKPLLSATYSSNTKLNFPYLASRKLDGIRCLIIDGKPVSRSLIPIPNKFIQLTLSNSDFNNLDGELICGAENDPACLINTKQIVMSHDRRQEFIFHVFDDISCPDQPFEIRLATAASRIKLLNHPNIKLVEHRPINNMEEFESLEREYVSSGNEGMMIRSFTGRYKFGRSTANENILTKVKRFSDSEAIVIGFEELQQNNNEAVKDALGYQKRASCQENKKGLSSLGAFLCRDIKSRVEFRCGTGLTAEVRQIVWNDRPSYMGLTLKYKFFAVGVKNKPRHPVFLGWRGDE